MMLWEIFKKSAWDVQFEYVVLDAKGTEILVANTREAACEYCIAHMRIMHEVKLSNIVTNKKPDPRGTVIYERLGKGKCRRWFVIKTRVKKTRD